MRGFLAQYWWAILLVVVTAVIAVRKRKPS